MRIENYFYIRKNYTAHYTLFNTPPPPLPKKKKRKKEKNYLSVVFAFCDTTAIPRGNTQIWSKDMTQQQTRTTYFKYHYNQNLTRLLSKRKLPPHCLQELHPY